MAQDLHFPLEHGNIQYVAGTSPAVGHEFVFNPDSGWIYRLRSLQLQLATSLVPGNRLVQVVIRHGSYELYVSPSEVFQVANETIIYRFSVLGAIPADTTALGFQNCNLCPDTFFYGSDQLKTLTDGIDGGDQFSAILLTLSVWPLHRN